MENLKCYSEFQNKVLSKHSGSRNEVVDKETAQDKDKIPSQNTVKLCLKKK